ncbi:MAG TPA: hypothetical protein DDX39_06645 [Bacteroidales bacterium]|nr:MAG: hypothetical protein A2W98_11315 [Bacteroidetes bacterium GWF2_33_38]OFY76673.1 MAG: hypothetical protein A2265_08940 [Bacteroidetes bacterium RIFOXYA12_FULL_33_9]OFY86768.1 MAG: hypothetical protein A2236_10455 [Bacteroidetes bacterium RIFOXYA2_FULL_33_7]HBF88305.1 hypothetical protein [Bacteroidales bacterium]
MYKFLIKILLVSFLFVGCTKFEEGPKISLFSKAKRIIRTWEIEYVHDLTVDEIYTSDYDGWSFSPQRNSVYSKKHLYNGIESQEDGFWKFEDDILFLIHEEEEIEYEEQYKVLRLTTKELWISNDKEEIHYVVQD